MRTVDRARGNHGPHGGPYDLHIIGQGTSNPPILPMITKVSCFLVFWFRDRLI